MSAFVLTTFLLGLSLAGATDFTPVYEWGGNKLDLDWISAAERAKAVEDDDFSPSQIKPEYMAVHAGRVFLSLNRYKVPVSLVSLPTTSASSTPPKLTPFPSWQFHTENCSSIQQAIGLEVDTKGRLWVLDIGSEECPAKLWIFNLQNNDQLELEQQIPSPAGRALNDIVLDETPDDLLAYMADERTGGVEVFSLKRREWWSVKTPGKSFNALALSAKGGQRRLLLRQFLTSQVYALPVSELRQRKPIATPTLVATWTNEPYRMLVDSNDVLYAAFFGKAKLLKWKITEQFNEGLFYQAGSLRSSMPFTFALDATGTFWLTERNETDAARPRFKLLKAAVGTRSYLYSGTTVSAP